MQDIVIDKMDKVLVDIYNIKDIEEIKYTDLVPFGSSSKIILLPSIYVSYDGGKYLNLCSKDKYFDVFVKKVYEVYQKEKDRLFTDRRFSPFGLNSKIKIDDKTKSILESGSIFNISNVYDLYDNKKSYNNSLLFQIDELNMILPIIKYHIKSLFDKTNLVVNFDESLLNGYKNNYSLNYKVNGLDDLLLLNYEKSNNNYYVKIKSRNNNFPIVVIKLQFDRDKILISSVIDHYNLVYTDLYQVEESHVNHMEKVYKDQEMILYNNKTLDRVDNNHSNLTLLDSNDDNLIFYKLPWDGYYGVSSNTNKLGELESVYSSHNKYLGIVDDNFMIREFLYVSYHRDKTLNTNAVDMVLDEACKCVTSLKQDSDIYVIETSFLDTLKSSGYYDFNLEGKYFYHVLESDSLDNIKKDNLVSINQDNDIICNADLLDNDTLRKVIRGV